MLSFEFINIHITKCFIIIIKNIQTLQFLSSNNKYQDSYFFKDTFVSFSKKCVMYNQFK